MLEIHNPTLRRVLDERNLTLAAEQHSQNSHFPEPAWPTMGDDAYHGLAGEVVRAIAPHTESDPVAILIQLPSATSSAIVHTTRLRAAATARACSMYLLGKARKPERAHHGIAFQKLSGSRTSDGTASASRVVCPPVKGSLMKFATNSRNGTERRERGRWSILASPTSA